MDTDDAAKKPGPAPLPQQPAGAPRGALSLGLIPEEQAAVAAEGKDPKEWVALVQQADAIGIGLGIDPTSRQPAVKFVIEVSVPLSVLPLQFSNVVDPRTGQPQPSERMRKAFLERSAPVVRLLVHRSALADHLRNALALEEARVAALAGITAPSAGDET